MFATWSPEPGEDSTNPAGSLRGHCRAQGCRARAPGRRQVDRVWLSKHSSAPITEHLLRSDAHPSEGDNFAVGGRRWVRTCTPGTAHNLARCGYFSTLPTMSAGAGTLGDRRPRLVPWRASCASTLLFLSGKSLNWSGSDALNVAAKTQASPIASDGLRVGVLFPRTVISLASGAPFVWNQ